MIKKLLNNKHLNSFIAQVGASGIAIISFIILVRTMSLEMFGQWGLFLAMLTFLDLLKSGFVATAFIKYSSGENEFVKNKLLASSWVLNISSLLVITSIFYPLYFLNIFSNESINLFLFYYPLYGVVSMPYHYNEWNSRIYLNMSRLMKIKIFNAILFLSVCILSIYEKFSLTQLVIAYISTFTISSIVSIKTGRTGINIIANYTKQNLIKLVLFGRYNILAFLGANLLKSSDTFLISAFLGDKALAIYLIPQRLWILVITPLASANTIAFTVFSSNHNKKMFDLLKTNIEKYIGTLTILYIPFSTFLFIVAEPLVLLVGGERYIEAVLLFRIFLIYSVFVPFDQVIGVSLDAINKPNKNFIKVMIMAAVNIIGDLFVLIYYKNIELVAWVTLFTILSGALSGYFMLKNTVSIRISSILSSGYQNLNNGFIKCLEKIKLINSKTNAL
jgi:O-antigen/teichoic acid export membrane protein